MKGTSAADGIRATSDVWYTDSQLVILGIPRDELRAAIDRGDLVATTVGLSFTVRGDRLGEYLDKRQQAPQPKPQPSGSLSRPGTRASLPPAPLAVPAAPPRRGTSATSIPVLTGRPWSSGSAADEFRRRVNELVAKGVPRERAASTIVREDPGLQQRMQQEANQSRQSSNKR